MIFLGAGVMRSLLASTVFSVLTAAAASAATLTFDGFSLEPLSTGTYSESGMTILTTSSSLSSFYISGRLKFEGISPPNFNQIELTTGSSFDLSSVEITHSDAGDPIVFEGIRNGSVVSDLTIDADNYGSLSFTGFTNLDKVLVTMTGEYGDASFDNLTFDVAQVPIPASGMLLGIGLSLLALRRRPRV